MSINSLTREDFIKRYSSNKFLLKDINDKEVKKLKLIAKTRNTTGIKITKPNSDKNKGKIDFGY